MKMPVLPLLAGGMLCFAGYHVISSQTPGTQLAPPLATMRAPFAESVAGVGLIEPRTEDVAVASQLSGVVARITVSEGQRVQAGAPLFALDTRQVESRLRVQQAVLAAAQAQLARLQALPRPEELPPLLARIDEARADLVQREDGYQRSQKLYSSGALPEEELVRSRQAQEAAHARLRQLESEDRLLRAGAWQADLAVSAAAVTQAETELTRIQTELDLHQIHAPRVLDGAGQPVEWEVLQVNLRPGEYVGTPPGQPLIILGDAGPRNVRVDIDEHDIPRFHADGEASAYIRGAAHEAFKLRFIRLEPYVVPKKSLTGDSAERVDTRVLQAIYAFSRVVPDVHVGQQVDVYFNAQPGVGSKQTRADQ